MRHTQYISTRGQMVATGFTDVLVAGLAPDGGLAAPSQPSALNPEQIEAWGPLGYINLATEVVDLLATDIPREGLAESTQAAYGPQRFSQPIVPIIEPNEVTDGLTLVGLSKGPTMAFKNLTMQSPERAIPYVLTEHGQVLNILGVTSGDTGSAAKHAFRGQEGVSVFMFSLAGRTSPVQRAQMCTLQDVNIHNTAVCSIFDNCQALVKALGNDVEFKAAHRLGAVNSINIGQVAAQTAYYVWSWLRVTDAVEGGRCADYQVDVCVPSGNFGNIYTGFLARSIGVPICHLILATNENSVLEEFFSTDIYRPRSAEDILATSSPSTDISKASNLECFIWALLGPEVFVQRWAKLEAIGTLDLRDQLPRLYEEFGFMAGTSSYTDRLGAIRTVKERSDRPIDPHTADGITVVLCIMEAGFPTLVMETTKTAKFPQTMAEALGSEPEAPNIVADLLTRPQKVETIDNKEAPLCALIEERTLTH